MIKPKDEILGDGQNEIVDAPRPDRDKECAIDRVLIGLRNPLLLMSLPDRADLEALCRAHHITALDLLERAVHRARRT